MNSVRLVRTGPRAEHYVPSHCDTLKGVLSSSREPWPRPRGQGSGGDVKFVDGSRAVTARLPDDLNCSDSVDFDDINPLVLFVSNFLAWRAAYPDCPPENADINGDGEYPFFGDINPFVSCLTTGHCP